MLDHVITWGTTVHQSSRNPPPLWHVRDQTGNSVLRTTEGNLCIQRVLHPRGKRKVVSSSHPCHTEGDRPHHLLTWQGTSPVLGGKKTQKSQRSWVEACLLQQLPPSGIRLLLEAEINSAPHGHPYFSFHLDLCTCTKAIK